MENSFSGAVKRIRFCEKNLVLRAYFVTQPPSIEIIWPVM